MSNSKPVLRAVRVPSDGIAPCDGCYFNTPEGFTCNVAGPVGYTCNVGGTTAALAPAKCCNFNGNGEYVIFKEVAREPVCNPA